MNTRAGARRVSRISQDYRGFTRRLGVSVTLDELARKLVDAVVETVGATGAIAYLPAAEGRGLRATGAGGDGYPAPTFAEDDQSLITALRARRTPLVLENGSTAAWRGSG